MLFVEEDMTQRYVHWQEKGFFVGYWEDFPDYPTQGPSEAELRENLLDIYSDITRGLVENVRRIQQAVPRHREISEFLARAILRALKKP
jgi:predicted RNase H-like HicB family nuclease